jgi:hypothetical protein
MGVEEYSANKDKKDCDDCNYENYEEKLCPGCPYHIAALEREKQHRKEIAEYMERGKSKQNPYYWLEDST